MAVLRFPCALFLSADEPIPVLYTPLVRLNRRTIPSAVLFPEYPPSGGGLTARAIWLSAKSPIAKRLKNDTVFRFISSFDSFVIASCSVD